MKPKTRSHVVYIVNLSSKYSAFRVSVGLNVLLLVSLIVFTTRPLGLPPRHHSNASAPHRTKPNLGDSEALNSSNFNNYNSLDRPIYFNCETSGSHSQFAQRGEYWVLYNYVKAEKQFGTFDSITYSTHSDFTFLDNLETLVERWKGPVSIAVYSPGSDFTETLRRIFSLRECSQSLLVKSYVTFHLFFESGQFPSPPIPPNPSLHLPTDCTSLPHFGEKAPTYRKSKGLPYPINVARNVARESSNTFYVLSSDIELYPSPNLIPQFLTMIQSNNAPILNTSKAPKVFVLPVFELEVHKNTTQLPQNKSQLQSMLRDKSAVTFHKFVCESCHRIPRQFEWNEAKEEPSLGIFHVAKRERPFDQWEPIYIGTKSDPIYDERLSWEGQKDKMTQGYALCLLGYEFHILNNAFLLHRPGIKRLRHERRRWTDHTNSIIHKSILPELNILYGRNPLCQL